MRSLTQHGIQRTSQRGIRADDLKLIELIGTPVEGGYLVRKKDVQAYIRDRKKEIDRANRLAGGRIVKAGDVVVSAYHANPGKKRRLLRTVNGRR